MRDEGDQFAGTSLLSIYSCSGDDLFVCDDPYGNGIWYSRRDDLTPLQREENPP